ncbi:MAG: hypothetical protein MUF31_02810 [Akkermansiaceae bacterium]|nr:hypothetical protein [Akkermansiaceae bacterium]
MIDPKRDQRSFNSSRIALALALLLAGAFGIATSIYVKPGKASPQSSLGAETSKPERPKAAATERGGSPSPRVPDAEYLVEFCSKNVTETRSFVIFRYGTCVVVQEPSEDPLADAIGRLEACNDPEARFVPELTAESDLIVSFKEPVFHLFTESQRLAIQDELDALTPALLTPAERATAGDDWVPPTQARFGLLARRRMLEDAAKPVAIKVIRAKNRVAGGKS